MFQLQQISVWLSNSQQPRRTLIEILWKPSFSSAFTQLIIIHEAAHVKPQRTRLVLQMEALIDCSDALWIYLSRRLRRLRDNERGKAGQQPGFTCNFSSDSPASLLSLPASVCIVCLAKAVRVWHGQTRTKWIHRWGESGSEETERGREQALQYGPGENCTGTLQYVRVCVWAVHGHINIKWVSLDIYIKMCPVSIVHVCPGGHQASISNAALKSVMDIHLQALWAITMMFISLSLSFQNKETNNQTVEQGAVVAEEEVKLSSALSSPISLLLLTFF